MLCPQLVQSWSTLAFVCFSTFKESYFDTTVPLLLTGKCLEVMVGNCVSALHKPSPGLVRVSALECIQSRSGFKVDDHRLVQIQKCLPDSKDPKVFVGVTDLSMGVLLRHRRYHVPPSALRHPGSSGKSENTT